GTVSKFTPAPPNIDRPALGYVGVDNKNVDTYHGTEKNAAESPSSPMPGKGGPDVIIPDNYENLQETE
ncbi:MAG: hypothetical protein ACRETG_04655, partial [Steroidobacteraceae bacterium]